MKLIIVRHGQTEENRRGIIQGQKRGTLSKLGEEQAKQVAEELKDIQISQIYSSDLKRAVDTVEQIAKFHKNAPLHFTNQLREINTGKFGVLPLWFPPKLVNKALILAMELNLKTPGGESWKSLKRREAMFLNHMYSKYPDKTILLVTHGITMRAIRSLLSSPKKEARLKKEDVPNCAVWNLTMNKPVSS